MHISRQADFVDFHYDREKRVARFVFEVPILHANTMLAHLGGLPDGVEARKCIIAPIGNWQPDSITDLLRKIADESQPQMPDGGSSVAAVQVIQPIAPAPPQRQTRQRPEAPARVAMPAEVAAAEAAPTKGAAETTPTTTAAPQRRPPPPPGRTPVPPTGASAATQQPTSVTTGEVDYETLLTKLGLDFTKAKTQPALKAIADAAQLSWFENAPEEARSRAASLWATHKERVDKIDPAPESASAQQQSQTTVNAKAAAETDEAPGNVVVSNYNKYLESAPKATTIDQLNETWDNLIEPVSKELGETRWNHVAGVQREMEKKFQ